MFLKHNMQLVKKCTSLEWDREEEAGQAGDGRTTSYLYSRHQTSLLTEGLIVNFLLLVSLPPTLKRPWSYYHPLNILLKSFI